MNAIRTDVLTVPYKGTAPAMNDLLGGQVDFMCDQTTNTTGQIKAGKGTEVSIWHALYAPKGTPKPVLDRLVAAMQSALKDEGVRQKYADLGALTYPPDKQTPQALQQHLEAETDKWASIIKKAGVYAD